MAQQGEASVEEILESIKKVMARDNRTAAIEQREKRAREGLVTRTLDVREQQPEPADEEEAGEVLDLSNMDFAEHDAAGDDDDRQLRDGPGADALDPEGDEDDDDVPLTNEAVRGAMRDNLAALAMLAEPGVPPQIVRSGETSLEGLVREMLRPMLAQWLDANLPAMVEKMVQAEIARIAGKRR